MSSSRLSSARLFSPFGESVVWSSPPEATHAHKIDEAKSEIPQVLDRKRFARRVHAEFLFVIAAPTQGAEQQSRSNNSKYDLVCKWNNSNWLTH